MDADGEKLGPATVSRRIRACRFFFNRAVRWKWWKRTPSRGSRLGPQSITRARLFVPLKDVEKIIASTTDLEFRAVVALSRLGALRCPSETLILRWIDVRWDEGVLLVRSPKTEAYAGGESRIVPCSPAYMTFSWISTNPSLKVPASLLFPRHGTPR